MVGDKFYEKKKSKNKLKKTKVNKHEIERELSVIGSKVDTERQHLNGSK